MALQTMEINSRSTLLDLLSELRCLHLNRDLKIISGSFDLNLTVSCQFRLSKDGSIWDLYCLDDKGGSGYLRRTG